MGSSPQSKQLLQTHHTPTHPEKESENNSSIIEYNSSLPLDLTQSCVLTSPSGLLLSPVPSMTTPTIVATITAISSPQISSFLSQSSSTSLTTSAPLLPIPTYYQQQQQQQQQQQESLNNHPTSTTITPKFRLKLPEADKFDPVYQGLVSNEYRVKSTYPFTKQLPSTSLTTRDSSSTSMSPLSALSDNHSQSKEFFRSIKFNIYSLKKRANTTHTTTTTIPSMSSFTTLAIPPKTLSSPPLRSSSSSSSMSISQNHLLKQSNSSSTLAKQNQTQKINRSSSQIQQNQDAYQIRPSKLQPDSQQIDQQQQQQPQSLTSQSHSKLPTSPKSVTLSTTVKPSQQQLLRSPENEQILAQYGVNNNRTTSTTVTSIKPSKTPGNNKSTSPLRRFTPILSTIPATSTAKTTGTTPRSTSTSKKNQQNLRDRINKLMNFNLKKQIDEIVHQIERRNSITHSEQPSSQQPASILKLPTLGSLASTLNIHKRNSEPNWKPPKNFEYNFSSFAATRKKQVKFNTSSQEGSQTEQY